MEAESIAITVAGSPGWLVLAMVGQRCVGSMHNLLEETQPKRLTSERDNRSMTAETLRRSFQRRLYCSGVLLRFEYGSGVDVGGMPDSGIP